MLMLNVAFLLHALPAHADRYRNAQGHMEDAPPPLNETPIADIRPRRSAA